MRPAKTLTVLGVLCALLAVGSAWYFLKKKDGASSAGADVTQTRTTEPQTDDLGADGPDTGSESHGDDPQPEDEPEVEPEPKPAWGPSAEQLATAEQAAADMSDEELAGQVIIAHFSGVEADPAVQLVANYHLAGIILMGNNIVDGAQIIRVSDAVQKQQEQAERAWPAIISVDQEGGRVSRLRGVVDDVPAFAELAAAGTDTVTQTMEHLAAQMHDLGFTMDFAPIADVSIGAQDPTIGDRSAGSDPHEVSEAVAAAVAGLEAGGIVPVIKHFPGHGSVTVDSHVDVPVQDRSLDELREKDFVPFSDAIAAGVPVIMMGHIALTEVDPGVPATLSAPAYDVLRTELGFEGVIVTDAMNMQAVTKNTDAGAETVVALAAGADLVLMPPDTAKAHGAVVAALDSGELEREQLEASAARVIALQLWAGSGL